MEYLKDPDNTRFYKELPLPPSRPLQPQLLFQGDGVDVGLLKECLMREGRVAVEEYKRILKQAALLFKSQPNLIAIEDPITIVGDLHGQFFDFLKLLETEVGGNCDTTKYLFLGDYVDRGNFSIEVLLLILAMKISRPKQVIMLRGNHECRQLTSHFSFRQECLRKYNQEAYELTMELFDQIPLAALLNGKLLCMHGGISQELKSLDDIMKIDRFKEIPKSGLFCDLMWADPVETANGSCQPSVKFNKARGCSYYFGTELAKSFFERAKIVSVIRAHEAQAEGYKFHKWLGADKFPAVITIFSAPNYCDFYNNMGAVIKLENNMLDIKQFKQSPHPYLLPNFMNLFEWTVPFIIEKMTELLYHMVKPDEKYDLSQLPMEMLIQTKLLQKMIEQQKHKMDENLALVSLDGNCPDERLWETGQYKAGKIESFQEKKHIDERNEGRPDAQV